MARIEKQWEEAGARLSKTVKRLVAPTPAKAVLPTPAARLDGIPSDQFSEMDPSEGYASGWEQMDLGVQGAVPGFGYMLGADRGASSAGQPVVMDACSVQ